MATSTIDQECDIIEDSASELRELISQLSEGTIIIKEKEGELFELVDKIKESCDDITGFYDDLESKLEKAEEKIQEYEDEEEATLGNEIEHTTISYECSNFLDTQIMEALSNCLHINSGIEKKNLLNILESLPTNLAFKRA